MQQIVLETKLSRCFNTIAKSLFHVNITIICLFKSYKYKLQLVYSLQNQCQLIWIRFCGIGFVVYIVGRRTYKIFVVEGTDTFHVHLKQWERGRVREGKESPRHDVFDSQCTPSPSDCQKAWHASTLVRDQCARLVCASFARHAHNQSSTCNIGSKCYFLCKLNFYNFKDKI